MVKSKEDVENSSIVCGYIVNEILQKIYTNQVFEGLRWYIHEECCRDINFICKLIANSLNWKQGIKPKIYLQNYIVHDSLGTNRLLLVRTLYLIINNDSYRGYIMINNITEQCWQALIFWFIELKHQNMYQNLVLSLFEIAFKYGSEELILLILLKANILSPLLVAYRDVFQNGTLMKMFHVDDFIYSVRRLVSYIQCITEERKDLKKTQRYITRLQSWIELRKEFILKTPFVAPTQITEEGKVIIPPPAKGDESPGKSGSNAILLSSFSRRETQEAETSSRKEPSQQEAKAMPKLINTKALNMVPSSTVKNLAEIRDKMKPRGSISKDDDLHKMIPEKNKPVLVRVRSQSLMKSRQSSEKEVIKK